MVYDSSLQKLSWMAAETWSELINDHYQVAPSLRFSGENLLKAVS
jgi:hypothetical protein